MDDSQVKAVTEWPQPTTIKELQRFLGFANFYRRFKDKLSKLRWNVETNHAFANLKKSFTTAPFSSILIPTCLLQWRLMLLTVVSMQSCLNAMDNQESFTSVLFFYRKLTSAERNYDVGNKELLSMKAAIEEWRHWLEGAIHPFQIITDQENLECQEAKSSPNSLVPLLYKISVHCYISSRQ